MVALGIAGLALLVAGAAAFVLGLQSTVLDRTAVERDVAAQFEIREGISVELSCADEMEVDRGATYACSGTTADGEEITLRIDIVEESSAAYTWTEP